MTMQQPTEVDVVANKLSLLNVRHRGAQDVIESEYPLNSPLPLDNDMEQWLDEVVESMNGTVNSNMRVYTKLLVSNAAAGSIIGKAGSNINSFQAQTSARMQLSKSEEYFPGTLERTLLISGKLKHVVSALGLVLSKLVKENVAPLSPRYKASLAEAKALEEEAAAAAADTAEQGEEDTTTTTQNKDNNKASTVTTTDFEDSDDPRLMIKLLVPQPLCGIVIGKSGSTIRNCSADTDTSIRLQSADGPLLELTHKIFLISGELPNILKAIALFIMRQSQDLKYLAFQDLQSSYIAPPQPGQQVMQGGHNGGAAAYYATMPYQPHTWHEAGEGNFYSMVVMLTDQQVAVLGSTPMGKSAIEQAEHATGTRVRLHKDSLRLTIAGPMEAVQMCHYMLNQRLTMVAMQQHQYGGAAGGYMSPTSQLHYYNNSMGGYYNNGQQYSGQQYQYQGYASSPGDESPPHYQQQQKGAGSANGSNGGYQHY